MSLYQWFVNLPADSLPMLNDLVRMGIIQLVVQFLFYVVNPAENPFFSTIFLQTIGFVLVGVLVYWLIVRNLFEFKAEPESLPPPARRPSRGGVVEGFAAVSPPSHTDAPTVPDTTTAPDAEDDGDEGEETEGGE